MLYLSTPLNRIIALNPETGTEAWRYDPTIKLDISRSEGFVSRGVSFWQDSDGEGDGPCQRRVFMGTVEATVIALDANTGLLCQDFGDGGIVRLDHGVGSVDEGQYGVTSPPAIVGDVVEVGSAIGDNRRVDLERGTVRAYGARTGDLRWAWDPIPRGPEDLGWDTWTPEGARLTGAANAWAPISADPERDMVFVPTGSASPDFYGGERPGAATCMSTRWWRCAPLPARHSGTSRSFITICGISTWRRSRRSSPCHATGGTSRPWPS